MPFESNHLAHSGAQITLHAVDVTLGGNPILHDVHLTVTPSSRISIIGENGRGKTTLLHVLAGRLTRMQCRGSVCG
ncbi:ATP-binding cassette domain-containing protein [Enteractinococcus coprophilus]|uniref:ATP-binding cassette domain-containing protein n=1 Tax=Enteractinococcus coprophilus TaxID=1027633 RepID=UPI00114E349E|nr:ATP-binding cassette domain-containing protein [Enteractinococcus coprophilus]